MIDEGRGECIYDVGVPLGEFGNTSGGASSAAPEEADSQESNRFGLANDDFMASVATLQSIAETLNADCVLLREKLIDNERKAAQYLIRLRADEKVRNTMLPFTDFPRNKRNENKQILFNNLIVFRILWKSDVPLLVM